MNDVLEVAIDAVFLVLLVLTALLITFCISDQRYASRRRRERDRRDDAMGDPPW